MADSPITDIGERRLAWMDEYSVDMQMLSYGDNTQTPLLNNPVGYPKK